MFGGEEVVFAQTCTEMYVYTQLTMCKVQYVCVCRHISVCVNCVSTSAEERMAKIFLLHHWYLCEPVDGFFCVRVCVCLVLMNPLL